MSAAAKAAAFAALVQGASAFVPTGASAGAGHLRSTVAGSVAQAPGAAAEASSSSSFCSTVGATAAAAAVLGAAASLRPAAKQSRSAVVATRAVGVSAPFFEKFDPLNLSNTPEKLERYTQVEIKHGRVAMIACVGYAFPEIFRWPGCEGFKHGLGAFESIPAEGWLQLIALIGVHEIFVKPREGALHASDFGLGVELMEKFTDEEVERKLTSERNNGRLAMIAIFGMMWQDGTFGKPPGQMLADEGFWGPPVDWIVRDIPACATYTCAVAPTEGRTARKVTVYEDPFPTMPGLPEQKKSPACPWLDYPYVLEGWTGGEKGFDPLGFSDRYPVYILREAELKHGRICMLATIGWIATDLGARFPADVFQNTTTVNAHLDCVKAGYMQPFLGFLFAVELYSLYICWQGYNENITRLPGDYFVGKQFLPKDEAKAEDMKLKELENGRLAMLAFSGIVTQAVALDKIGQGGFPYFGDIHDLKWTGPTGLLAWQYQLPGANPGVYWLEYEGTFSFLHDFGMSIN